MKTRRIAHLLILIGSAVLLHGAYMVWGTGLQTRAAQAELGAQWELGRDRLDPGQPAGPDAPTRAPTSGTAGEPGAEKEAGRSDRAAASTRAPPPIGQGVLRIDMRRPSTGRRVVLDAPTIVVEGVAAEQLTAGPGRYPETVMPGEPGNAGIAGHRTTYSAPFSRLDELRADDEIRVEDRLGETHTYRVVEQRIVGPDDRWVLSSDPLQTQRPTLTLTTCHPRFSDRQRLVVFAELAS